MHEEKIALVDGQVKAVQQAVAARAVENVYFVACGGSLATLYPGKYILERETAAVSTGAYTAAEFLNDPPARLGEKSLVVLNSQSGGTPETAAAARLATGRGALTAAFTTTPGSALEQAADHIVYYFDDPASPYPAVLTIFPEVYKLCLLYTSIVPAPHKAENGERHGDGRTEREHDASEDLQLVRTVDALSLIHI